MAELHSLHDKTSTAADHPCCPAACADASQSDHSAQLSSGLEVLT